LANSRDYAEALGACNTLLQSPSADSDEVLRIRAYVYSRSGQFDRAIDDYCALLESGRAELRDWYLAADNALEAARYQDAAKWFAEVICLGDAQGETWFRSASIFYLAYCKLMLGDTAEALRLVSLVSSLDPDIELYLPSLGTCNAGRLHAEICKQMSQ
jgi:tetratricopeptide (TPR) repeat protein